LWGSDLEKYPFNVTGFRSARVDAILAASKLVENDVDGAPLWKEFQCIINDQQPCTMLYWIDEITGVNTRVEGTHIGILGTTQEAWEWHLEADDVATVEH
ncbi:MAG TPA: ABC transporter substrate-binding protein, partial [Bacteroidota bacterium]|nr:ABC transporter substrate-binding protein [Bacteroidota bacterium]